MSEAEDAVDETTSSSEDEEPEIDETQDKFFFKTLSCLKNKDPKIYDPNIVFFPKDSLPSSSKTEDVKEEKVKKKEPKPVFLRDYEREQVVKIMDGRDEVKEEEVEEEDEVEDTNLPYVQQQKNLKASFKAALEDSESESEDLLKVKTKSTEEKEREEEDYKAWLKGNRDELDDKETERDLKPLHDFWSKPDLDSNELFLRDYILNKRYLDAGEEAEDDGISEDGELLEMQEKFEVEYNLRFENETNTETKRYPRVIEGSLRKKDESRSEKRKRRLERKKMEKDKRKQEIAKKQKEKLLEFKEQVDKIKKLTGNDQLGFRDEEIFGDDDFDPDAHDKKMQALYSDAFYSAGTEDFEKPDFGDDDDIAGPEDAEDEEPGPDNMDLEAAGTSSRKSKKESRSKKKRKEKKKAFTDIIDIAKPVFDPTVHNTYQKYIDDYYGMDCEDFIEDLPCRFKYRETVPNDYGLTVEEILAADDKELDKWVPAKKITKLRPEHVEKNEVKVYKQKGRDFNLKKKILASVYGSPVREEDDDVNEPLETEVDDTNLPNTLAKTNTKKKRALEETPSTPPATKKKKKSDSQTTNDAITHKPNKSQQNGAKKKNKFQQNRQKTGRQGKDNEPQMSDLRLKAYDIKPREFKKKMKFKK